MEKAVLVLVMLVTLAVLHTEAALDFTGWTPTCEGDGSITLPHKSNFLGFDVEVIDPPTCTKKSTDLDQHDLSIEKSCFNSNPVKLRMEHKNLPPKSEGGLDYHEVTITCPLVNGTGSKQAATVHIPVQNPTKTPNIDVQTKIPLELEVASGSNGATATPTQGPIYLGQPDIFLRVKRTVSGSDPHYVLVPLSCNGTDGPDKYYFFRASKSSCALDKEIMEKFTVITPSGNTGDDITYAKFYPFKFNSNNDITLLCEVLVCPESTTAKETGGTDCDAVRYHAENCLEGTVSQSRRRRRSASGQEPHTRVLEVTYSIASSDPALQGHTAAGAHVAVSIPLLAAVASLWIL